MKERRIGEKIKRRQAYKKGKLGSKRETMEEMTRKIRVEKKKEG